MKAVVIDDEKHCHVAIHSLLEKNHPEIELIKGGFNVFEGIQVIKKHQPDLVFLDIQMPESLGQPIAENGFKVIEYFEWPLKFQVIFTTSFNEYVLSAIQFGALDYLLKPIGIEDLGRAIKKAEHWHDLQNIKQQLEIMQECLLQLKEEKLPSRMAVATSEGIQFIQIEEIIRLQADQNYTHFVLSQQEKKLLASTNIGEFEKRFFPYSAFMRVSRSHMVNLHFAKVYVKSEGGYLAMKNGDQVSVSPKKKEELIRRMGEI